MKQTPPHDRFNPDTLSLMRPNFDYVVEVGASRGALARAYREINPYCRYTGIEIDPSYAEVARQHCSDILVGNIEHVSDDVFKQFNQADCWVFSDVLEHLYDPWELLRKIKKHAEKEVEIIACIPNAQHWSVQAYLCNGMFQYQDEGLLDRTHIRFFTRHTMIELFESTGYKILNGFPRNVAQAPTNDIIAAIKTMAIAVGFDPEQAASDAIPFQWVIRAVPA